jgi:hypothetical protein
MDDAEGMSAQPEDRLSGIVKAAVEGRLPQGIGVARLLNAPVP